MKKTIFLSLVAGAIIFSGCGGGGGGGTSSTGGSTSSSSGGASSSSGGATSSGGASSSSGGTTNSSGGQNTATYIPYQYPNEVLDTAGLISVQANSNVWDVNPDARQVGDAALDKTYAQAVQFCADKNQTLPSPKDLLTTGLRPTDGTSASWAADQYIAYYTDNIVGQSAKADLNTQRKVICMKGESIEKKHMVDDLPLSVDDNGTTKNVTGSADIVTGLNWTPIYTYDKDIINPGHSNQFRFPMTGATGNDITAAAYCQKFGAGWRLPTLAEARTITYLDGTTGLKDPENLKPTVIWTSTPGANAGTHYAVHLNPNGQTTVPYYSEAPEADEDKYFVTCVNPN